MLKDLISFYILYHKHIFFDLHKHSRLCPLIQGHHIPTCKLNFYSHNRGKSSRGVVFRSNLDHSHKVQNKYILLLPFSSLSQELLSQELLSLRVLYLPEWLYILSLLNRLWMLYLPEWLYTLSLLNRLWMLYLPE